jgi:UPF0755 protein
LRITLAPNQIRLLITGGITLLVLLLSGFIIWLMLSLRAVDHKSTQVISYTLVKGTSASEIADQLETKGIIRNAQAFNLYITLTGMHNQLQAGTYDLSPSQSSGEIAALIAHGRVAANRLVVPEGATLIKFRQIADQRGINPGDLDAALQAADYQNDFIKAKPQGTSLEGYLFPDSYEIMKPVRAHALVQAMLDNFGKKIAGTDVIQSYAAEGLTLHQGITLASIVEKEVSNDQDRKIVAQLYLNRLKAGMPLQADPTVDYVAETTGTTFNLQSSSPYNTYVVKGLPPGPICNPGLNSIEAVAHPQSNDYLYFVSGKDGKNHYARTFAEHQKNVDMFLK